MFNPRLELKHYILSSYTRPTYGIINYFVHMIKSRIHMIGMKTENYLIVGLHLSNLNQLQIFLKL